VRRIQTNERRVVVDMLRMVLNHPLVAVQIVIVDTVDEHVTIGLGILVTRRTSRVANATFSAITVVLISEADVVGW
jgi:hypothetical protein